MARRIDLRAAARLALVALALAALGAAALLALPATASVGKMAAARREAFARGGEGPDWGPLMEMNGETAGWLRVEGTGIDLPVVQPSSCDEADRYLHRDITGAWSPYGTPYLDRRCDPQVGNLMVFGHNAGIPGVMFSELAGTGLDSLGNASWSTPEGGEIAFRPIMALKVDYRYGPIQEFPPMSEAELIGWLGELEVDVSAVVDGWREAARGSTRALSLVTCSTPWAGCDERVIVIFVA